MPRPDSGSVYQRHDHKSCVEGPHRCYGRWVAAVTVAPGKRVVRYRKTKREALDELRRMLNERDRNALTADTTTVKAWLDHWYDTSAKQQVRESTLRGYKSKIDRYLVPALGSTRLTRLRPSDIERVYADLREQGLAPRTIIQAHAVLRRALAKAVRDGLIQANPADLAEKPRVRKKPPTVLAPQVVDRILEEASGDRMEARWWVALTLGLRQGEALGLTWPDVDFTYSDSAPYGSVTVRQSLQRIQGRGLQIVQPKSFTGYRTIPMRPACRAAMLRWQERQERERIVAADLWHDDGTPWVFTTPTGKPVDPHRDWESWNDLLERAGVPKTKMHTARHSAITGWLLSGVPMHTAKVWAGHASIQMTSDTYGGFVPEMNERGMAALEGQASPRLVSS